MRIPTATLLLFAALTTPSVQGTVYKWQDEDGKVHYTQTPPADAEFEIISPLSPPKGAGQPDERLKQQLKGFEERRQTRNESEQERATAQQNAQIKQQNCEAARANLTMLQSRGQIRLKEGDTYRILPEEERQEKISEAKRQIEEHCA